MPACFLAPCLSSLASITWSDCFLHLIAESKELAWPCELVIGWFENRAFPAALSEKHRLETGDTWWDPIAVAAFCAGRPMGSVGYRVREPTVYLAT